jgi:hypothetical protein
MSEPTLWTGWSPACPWCAEEVTDSIEDLVDEDGAEMEIECAACGGNVRVRCQVLREWAAEKVEP